MNEMGKRRVGSGIETMGVIGSKVRRLQRGSDRRSLTGSYLHVRSSR